MRTLIFSDTHLSGRVYKRKFNYLKSIIEPADQVIILGDFWDGFLTSFGGFVSSGWQELFPLLRDRQALYFYGNHDLEPWADDRVNLFSVAQHQALSMELGGLPVHLTHGNTIILAPNDRYQQLNHSVPLRIGASFDILHKLVWGNRFLRANKDINDPLREFARDHVVKPTLLICGHSHYPEVDLPNRMVNTGFIGCGYGNYIVIEDGEIKPTNERYWRRTWDV